MKHIQTYGETLKQLLSDYDLSVSALCMRLHLSSRTLISRVINGTCRPDTVTGFHDKLTAAANTLPFTAEDYALLKQALDVTRSGKPYYLLQARLDRILSGGALLEQPLCSAEDEALTFDMLLAQAAAAEEAHILVLNCSVRPVLGALTRFLASPHGCTEVRQYLHTDTSPEALAFSLLSVLPLLTSPDYRCLRVADDYGVINRRSDPEDFSAASADANRILICRRTGDEYYTDALTLIAPDRFVSALSIAGETLYTYQLNLAARMEECYQPVCTVIPDKSDFASFLTAMEALSEAEQNWQSILFKPDVCVHQLAPAIMARVLGDSPALALTKEEIAGIVKVQEARYAAYRDRRRHEVLILSKPGLRRFAETGLLSDHPEGVVPLSREEIRQVFEDILACMRGIGGFYMYVMRDEDFVPACIVKSYGDSTLSVSACGGGQLCIVRSRPETQFVNSYLLNTFIPCHAMSAAETEDFLAHLMESI